MCKNVNKICNMSVLKLPRLGVPGVIWKMVQNDQICCFRPRNDMETCQKYCYSAFWALPQLQSEYFGGKTIWIHLATMRFSLIFNGISGIFQVDFWGVGWVWFSDPKIEISANQPHFRTFQDKYLRFKKNPKQKYYLGTILEQILKRKKIRFFFRFRDA